MTYVSRSLSCIFVFACMIVALCAPAQAQSVRTWVSGVGDDANPCSRTAPCLTFAGAIAKTAAGGEIGVLDPGNFGSVTITKAISIVAEGAEGGVLAAGTNGIVVNAGAKDSVSIRGLTIEGAGTGIAGIRVLQAGYVYISNVVVRGFQSSPGYGVDIEPTNGALVYLKNVEINGNVTGIYLSAGGSSVSGVVTDTCTIAGNSLNSALLNGTSSILRAQGSSFANTPISISGGAQLISNGNNFFAGGSSAPTGTSPLQ